MPNPQLILSLLQKHYAGQLGNTRHHVVPDALVQEHYYLDSPALKPENGPRLLYHGKATDRVLILTHGLTDSPFYLLAIAKRFYAEGFNVLLPLLDGHGLKEPGAALKDPLLVKQWKNTTDKAVEVAQQIGGRLYLGGFSTGAALGLNKLLHDPDSIDGGLVFFSAALSIGPWVEWIGQFGLIRRLFRALGPKIQGQGPNPYRYPQLPVYAALELTKLIHENNRLLKGKRITLPTIAIHSSHDKLARIEGLHHFMKKYVDRGSSLLITQNVSHSNLLLDTDIKQDTTSTFPIYPAIANPQFDWMMNNVLQFLRSEG